MYTMKLAKLLYAIACDLVAEKSGLDIEIHLHRVFPERVTKWTVRNSMSVYSNKLRDYERKLELALGDIKKRQQEVAALNKQLMKRE